MAATLVAGLWLGARLERSGAETRALRDEVGALREMVALSMLRQPAAGERLEGVRYGQAATAEHGGRDLVGALFEVLREDRNTNVRLAAVDALLALTERPGVGEGIDERLYSAFSEVDSPLVQAAIAAGLLDRPGQRERGAPAVPGATRTQPPGSDARGVPAPKTRTGGLRRSDMAWIERARGSSDRG